MYTRWTLTPDSDPIPEVEATKPEEVQVDEEEFSTLNESPFSFRLSGPNKRLYHNDQLNEESASSGDPNMLSLRNEPRRRFLRKEKGKKKMPEYDTGMEESN